MVGVGVLAAASALVGALGSPSRRDQNNALLHRQQRTDAALSPLAQSPIAQVDWLCRHASAAVVDGQTDPFLTWVHSKCRAEDPATLLRSMVGPGGRPQAPLGDLICMYTKGAAPGSAHDKSAAALCDVRSPPQPTGIRPAEDADPPGQFSFAPTNVWSGYIGGQYTVVFAGGQTPWLFSGGGGDTNKSEILITEGVGAPQHIPAVYATGTDDGPLSIMSARGDVIQLSATDGATFAFDLDTDAFESPAAMEYRRLMPGE